MAKLKKVRCDIDHSLLKKLYIDEGYSIRKLQQHFGICGEHLRATLTHLGVSSNMRTTKNDYRPHNKTLTDYQVGFNKVKKAYLWGAKSRNLEFSLSDEEIDKLTHKYCYYCGAEPNQFYTIKERCDYKYYYNGIDRVNNNIGYNVDNVVPCCKMCNIAKHTFTQEEFYEWICRVYNNMQGGEK